jgi:hypothetical protein
MATADVLRENSASRLSECVYRTILGAKPLNNKTSNTFRPILNSVCLYKLFPLDSRNAPEMSNGFVQNTQMLMCLMVSLPAFC